VNAIGKLVVVRFLDKRILKGRIVDFHPDRDFFHVEEEGPRRRPAWRWRA